MREKLRILILGADGQLGRELQRSFADCDEVLACGRKVLDLVVPKQIRSFIRDAKPDIILNAAAYTAVDRAESEPELAMAVNGLAPGILTEEAQRIDSILVHFSTDYVFDGTKAGPWTEEDAPNPLNVYGASKLAGENAIRQVGGRYLIFRTSWVYSARGHNFLLTMIKLGSTHERIEIVNDQLGAPTSCIELSDATRTVVRGVQQGQFGPPSNWAGLYHMTCAGATSWYGFAQTIFAQVRTRRDAELPSVIPIPTSQYPTPAKRPLNSVLANDKLKRCFGIRLAHWESALKAVVRNSMMEALSN